MRLFNVVIYALLVCKRLDRRSIYSDAWNTFLSNYPTFLCASPSSNSFFDNSSFSLLTLAKALLKSAVSLLAYSSYRCPLSSYSLICLLRESFSVFLALMDSLARYNSADILLNLSSHSDPFALLISLMRCSYSSTFFVIYNS